MLTSVTRAPTRTASFGSVTRPSRLPDGTCACAEFTAIATPMARTNLMFLMLNFKATPLSRLAAMSPVRGGGTRGDGPHRLHSTMAENQNLIGGENQLSSALGWQERSEE